MSISSSNVLWGIAHPRCKLRNPNTLVDEQTLDLASPNIPAGIRFTPEFYHDTTALDGTLKRAIQGYRPHLEFAYQELTAAQTVQWAKIYNAVLADYLLIMVPHHDDTLQIEYDVLPEGDFQLGYIADKYIGHTGTFTFTGRTLISAIDLRVALNVFSPRLH